MRDNADPVTAFDGYQRSCARFALKKTKHPNGGFTMALRCAKFAKKSGYPACHPLKTGGGRSPGLINKLACRRRGRKGKR